MNKEPQVGDLVYHIEETQEPKIIGVILYLYILPPLYVKLLEIKEDCDLKYGRVYWYNKIGSASSHPLNKLKIIC